MASAERVSQVHDLVNQWETLTGFSVAVPDWAIWELANNDTVAGYVTSVYGIGQYMKAHTTPGPYNIPWDMAQFQPWAWYGMSSTAYESHLQAFDSEYRRLTGQSLPADLADQALRQHAGSMTASDFSTFLLNQDSLKATYGWLRFGLDYQQFLTQKLQMQTALGSDLTDQEAVTQLRYMHAAQGSNMSASAQPTLSQVERRQAQVGVGQSEVR